MHNVIRSLQWIYRATIWPFFGFSDACRFHPTCSDYCVESVEKLGLWRGLWLSLKRISRCNPWCNGGIDPVPEK